MVRVLFLLLTRLNVARSNGNQHAAKIFPFASYVRPEGHLYEVFLVLAKTRLI